jgi:hypothetical protein
MALMTFITTVMPDDHVPASQLHVPSYVTLVHVSSDTLPPLGIPDWLKDYAVGGFPFPEESDYTNLVYDADGKLISADWEGRDPTYLVGKYTNPNPTNNPAFNGWHGTGYPNKRLDELTVGDIPIIQVTVLNEDEEEVEIDAAVITLSREYDRFHFVTQTVVQDGKTIRKLVFVPGKNQEGYNIQM